MQHGIEGKSAVVTASTRGVGRAIALRLAEAGARVALNYLTNEEAARDTADAIRATGGEVLVVRADVTREDGAARLLEDAARHLGPIDILVNNAHGRIERMGVEASDWDLHRRHLEGVLKPAVLLSRGVVGGMRTRGFGRIVNIGSHIVGDPVKGYSGYTAAMASLLGLTRNLASEAGPWGITTNMVSPGFVRTERAPHTNPAVLEAIRQATPLRRLATPDDVAGPVIFLCSDLGGFVNGVNLPVDGGKVMGQG